MNDTQLARAKFIHDLRKLISPDFMQGQYHDLPLPTPDHFWLHFTDLPIQNGFAFFEELLHANLIAIEPNMQYQPRGDWLDHFPPDCYRLTAKGRHVLDNPGEYVYGSADGVR